MFDDLQEEVPSFFVGLVLLSQPLMLEQDLFGFLFLLHFVPPHVLLLLLAVVLQPVVFPLLGLVLAFLNQTKTTNLCWSFSSFSSSR